jgi:hypothetical protein
MEQISQDWEVVDRKLHCPPIIMFFMLILTLLGLDPGFFPSTWTLRRKSTGIVKRVTAGSQAEAADKIANGYFDPD